jgi:hypothetical protein
MVALGNVIGKVQTQSYLQNYTTSLGTKMNRDQNVKTPFQFGLEFPGQDFIITAIIFICWYF